MIGKKSSELFTDSEMERIRRAVEAAEATTSGEIATIVVDQSDSYREAETLGATLFSGLLALIVAVAIRHVTIWSYIPLVFIFFLPASHLFRQYPHLKLPFVGRRRVAEAVRERAVRAFFQKRLYKTRDETGILVFISILEHKVWILGDRGIDAKIDPLFWRSLADELVTGLKESRACDALCSIIAKCGSELALHFPKKADDINELPDDLMM